MRHVAFKTSNGQVINFVENLRLRICDRCGGPRYSGALSPIQGMCRLCRRLEMRAQFDKKQLARWNLRIELWDRRAIGKRHYKRDALSHHIATVDFSKIEYGRVRDNGDPESILIAMESQSVWEKIEALEYEQKLLLKQMTKMS